jgi:hypothetical protein
MNRFAIWLMIVAVGPGLLALGMWLYRNPTKLLAGWGILNPRNRNVQKLARAYAIFFIFVAC